MRYTYGSRTVPTSLEGLSTASSLGLTEQPVHCAAYSSTLDVSLPLPNLVHYTRSIGGGGSEGSDEPPPTHTQLGEICTYQSLIQSSVQKSPQSLQLVAKGQDGLDASLLPPSTVRQSLKANKLQEAHSALTLSCPLRKRGTSQTATIPIQTALLCCLILVCVGLHTPNHIYTNTTTQSTLPTGAYLWYRLG